MAISLGHNSCLPYQSVKSKIQTLGARNQAQTGLGAGNPDFEKCVGLKLILWVKPLEIESSLQNIKDGHIPGAQFLFTIPVCKAKVSDPRSHKPRGGGEIS